ncbi:hypothetical protein J7E26_09275 [Bacillus sp. ISL-51]|nr:hypothetical protein [Bacillus sp. ISL-51]
MKGNGKTKYVDRGSGRSVLKDIWGNGIGGNDQDDSGIQKVILNENTITL